MRPSVELRAASSPSRQAEHHADFAVFAGDLAGRAGPGGQHGQHSSSAAMACTAVAGSGLVRKDAVTPRRARGASPG
jgi:hypothetical protein